MHDDFSVIQILACRCLFGCPWFVYKCSSIALHGDSMPIYSCLISKSEITDCRDDQILHH